MPTFKKMTCDEFSFADHGGENGLHLERGEKGLTYTPEPSNFWGDNRAGFTYFVCLDDLKPVAWYKTAKGNDSRKKVNKFPVLGLAELQVNPHNPQEVWLKYVSVCTGHHGKGIGRELGRMVAEHLQGTGLHLRRSYSSELAISRGFQDYMDRVLAQYGVDWSQSGRDPGFGM